MFDSPEFYAPENYRAKIKTPFELLVSSLRALDADVHQSPALLGLLNKMGEPLYGYQAPTGYPGHGGRLGQHGRTFGKNEFRGCLGEQPHSEYKS